MNLGWESVKMPRPSFEGDTIYALRSPVEARIASRPHMGLDSSKNFRIQAGQTVVIGIYTHDPVYKRGHGPA